MADTTYYAWSPIMYAADVQEGTGVVLKNKTKKIGAIVTPESLGINEEEFQALVNSGAVRDYPFPEDFPEGYGGSPVDWLKRKARIVEGQVESMTSSLSTNAELERE